MSVVTPLPSFITQISELGGGQTGPYERYSQAFTTPTAIPTAVLNLVHTTFRARIAPLPSSFCCCEFERPLGCGHSGSPNLYRRTCRDSNSLTRASASPSCSLRNPGTSSLTLETPGTSLNEGSLLSAPGKLPTTRLRLRSPSPIPYPCLRSVWLSTKLDLPPQPQPPHRATQDPESPPSRRSPLLETARAQWRRATKWPNG